MTHEELKAFRKMVSLSQVSMAEMLGFSERNYQMMEAGKFELRPCIGLACAAYALGINEYNGPKIEKFWKQRARGTPSKQLMH